MADTRMDGPRGGEARAGKATAQSMTSAKSAAAKAGEQHQGFSALLASLDGPVNEGQAQREPLALRPAEVTLATDEQKALLAAQAQAPWMTQPAPALQDAQTQAPVLPPPDALPLSQAHAAWGAWPAHVRQDAQAQAPVLPPPDVLPLSQAHAAWGAWPASVRQDAQAPIGSQQDALLAAQGHAPWMSLVGQTQRLDTQDDADLRQGIATDFLSGRGNLTQLAHRQALQSGGTGSAGAHAAFMARDAAQNLPPAQAVPAQAAAVFDAADQGLRGLDVDRAESGQSAWLAAADAPATEASALARAESPMHRPQAQAGLSLQGMTSVPPQALEGLKDLLRTTRSPSLGEAAGSGTGAVNAAHGAPDMLGAAAVGGALAAGAGTPGGGQNSADQSLGAQDSPAAEREQEVSEQVAFWVHQKVQHAALSIQHEGKPIQVQVQLSGQEAHVRFAADDAQALQLLADDQAQLRELLQAQGLSLSGVSVDAGAAQQQAAGGQADEPRRGQARLARVAVHAAALPADVVGSLHTARAAQSGVDLFV